MNFTSFEKCHVVCFALWMDYCSYWESDESHRALWAHLKEAC